MDLRIDQAVHAAPDSAVNAHQAHLMADPAGTVDAEGSLLNDNIAHQQDLGQHTHDQENGDEGAHAQVNADGGNGFVGCEKTDDNARRGQHGAGGDDGGKGQVQRFDHSLAQRHLLLQFHVAAGDDDGIVDIGTHLNGADDQIGQEKQVVPPQVGNGKVAEDTALDDQDQQQGQAHRAEGEKQHGDDEQHRQHADEQIVVPEGGLQVAAAGGVPHQGGRPLEVGGNGDGEDHRHRVDLQLTADRQSDRRHHQDRGHVVDDLFHPKLIQIYKTFRDVIFKNNISIISKT